ncbi:MAG TPA: MarP family serine protease [Nocardioidaceae bacterium]|nr:MarP family serine protease [Nocardioidaceae bacterium]
MAAQVNGLDWLLVAFAVIYALSGYRQGFIVGACSTFGLLVGGALGVLFVPRLFDRFATSLEVSIAAVATVLVCAVLGQTVAAYYARTVRRQITWHPARAVDAVGGAVLSAAAAMAVAWALGIAVSGAQIPGVAKAVQSSQVLATVDRVLPGGADRALEALTDVVDQSVFPRYLDPFVPEQIVAVDPPTREVLRDPEIRTASRSVVKIIGTAESCARTIEGSGFVYAPERVMTNAHVVAGVDSPTVLIDGAELSAETVVYDPDLDIAVLAVAGLAAEPLDFTEEGRSGSPGAVLGFPENGPFDAEPARIRARQRLRSSDIYGQGTVFRNVFSVYASVRPGNSGGPMVSPDGDVYGVVFAASVSDDATGYAVTAEQVAEDAATGRDAADPVSTGGCA